MRLGPRSSEADRYRFPTIAGAERAKNGDIDILRDRFCGAIGHGKVTNVQMEAANAKVPA
jgi:hypothetical protein